MPLSSIQEKLQRVRPPRVRITYDVESGGAIEKKELPFIVGIFADLSGEPEQALPPVEDRQLVEIDRDSFDGVLREARPCCKLSQIGNLLPGGSGNLGGVLTFSCMDDFEPLAVVQRVPEMKPFWDERCRLRAMQVRAETSNPSIDEQVATLDRALAAQLNLILHAPMFQQLEATWRGMHYLVFRSGSGSNLKLRVMNIPKQDLRDDLDKAVDNDQSAIFKKIHDGWRGTPYSVLVGDFEFGRNPEDFGVLGKMAEIAAAAHAPFISAAYAGLADQDSFAGPVALRDLDSIFGSVELDGWRALHASEASRYVSPALPRVLLRLPYGDATVPVEGMQFEEDVYLARQSQSLPIEPDASRLLWGNPAFVLAERITHAFSLYGWTAAIRGIEGGGLVEGLASFRFPSGDGGIATVGLTRVTITDCTDGDPDDLGFLPICQCGGNDKLAFPGAGTAVLPYILSASRFVHYIKVIMRERSGGFENRGDVESFLNDWIAQYVLLDDNATQAVKAAYPLRSASIAVSDVAGRPGSYRATVSITPHFQLTELNEPIRLVVDLPGGPG